MSELAVSLCLLSFDPIRLSTILPFFHAALPLLCGDGCLIVEASIIIETITQG